MKKEEMVTVLERLEEYYRNFYAGTDRERVLNAWWPMFADDPAEEVTRAVVAYICTEKFAPTVSGIKTIMAENRMAGQMTEIQAWGRIRKAIDKADDRYNAAGEFAKMPPILQKIVSDPSQLRAWRKCSDDTLEGVIASNVQRSYRELAKREAVFYAIPGQLQSEQTWRVDAPAMVSLPEPVKQLTHEERFEKMDADAKAYREKYGGQNSRDMTDRVKAFVKPMTDGELKMHEAKAKREEAIRMERMRA
jgi:hypothetical protein